jgi:uncharacterized membrane protein
MMFKAYKKMSREKSEWSQIAVVVMMVAYIVWFSFLSIRQHEAFMTGGLDLGNFDQTVWNTSRGQFLRMTTVEGLYSRLGGHVEPILLLLVPLYWVMPDPRTLLVVQTVVLASGAWAAYRLSAWKLEYPAAGVAMAAVYLLSPVVEGANLFDFHPVSFAAALLLFATYYMLRGDFGRFALFAGLTAFCKEEMPAVVVLMGLYVWIIGHDRRGGGLATGAIVWFLVANLLIIPAFSPIGQNIHYVRYAELGGGLGEMARTALTDPRRVWQVATEPAKLNYLLKLLFPVGYLSLLAPVVLLLSTPSLAVNILSGYPLMYEVDLQHYSAPIWPFVLAAAILGIKLAMRGLEKVSGVRRGFLVGILVGYVVFLSFFNHLVRGRTPLSSTFVMPQVTAHDRLAARFLNQIPPKAVISAQNPFVSHLSHRSNVYIFPRVDDDTEWLLFDVGVEVPQEIYPFDNWPAYYATVTRFLNEETFGLVDAADGYLLLRRGAPARSLPESFYTFAWADSVPTGAEVAAEFGAVARLVGLDIELTGVPAVAVRSWWNQGDRPPPGWALMVALADLGCPGGLDEQWTPLPVTRWYPPADWQPEIIVRDQVDLAVPPGTPADCIGVWLGLMDEDGRPVATPVRIESTGKWTMKVEGSKLSVRLAGEGL